MAALVGSIDQGTSSTRFMVFEAGSGQVVGQHQQEVKQLFPHESWVEQDPLELLESVEICIKAVAEQLKKDGVSLDRLKGLGITNQRETTVVWHRRTGKPLNNAIVWCDARNGVQVGQLHAKFGQDHLRSKCGLPLATYFSATKLVWLLENVKEVKEAAEADELMFGTVDSWLVWNLTGGLQAGRHVTDVTNASRTMLMDIGSLQWSQELKDFFQLPSGIHLPKIQASSSNFGSLAGGPLKGLDILGVVGDQQVAGNIVHPCS